MYISPNYGLGISVIMLRQPITIATALAAAGAQPIVTAVPKTPEVALVFRTGAVPQVARPPAVVAPRPQPVVEPPALIYSAAPQITVEPSSESSNQSILSAIARYTGAHQAVPTTQIPGTNGAGIASSITAPPPPQPPVEGGVQMAGLDIPSAVYLFAIPLVLVGWYFSRRRY